MAVKKLPRIFFADHQRENFMSENLQQPCITNKILMNELTIKFVFEKKRYPLG